MDEVDQTNMQNEADQTNMQNEADSTKIAVINANIAFMRRDLNTITLSLKELASVYVTRENLADVAKLTEARIIRLEQSSNLWKWMSPTLSAILSATLTFFVLEYFQKLH